MTGFSRLGDAAMPRRFGWDPLLLALGALLFVQIWRVQDLFPMLAVSGLPIAATLANQKCTAREASEAGCHVAACDGCRSGEAGSSRIALEEYGTTNVSTATGSCDNPFAAGGWPGRSVSARPARPQKRLATRSHAAEKADDRQQRDGADE